jgi:hypothetical protein
MAFTGSFVCTSFKKELMQAKHNFTTGTTDFKMALYDNTATLTAATTAYTASGELANGNGYTTGGNTLATPASVPTTSGTTALIDFDDEAWTTATFTARGALIYNDVDAGNAACLVIDFGSDKTVTNGTFTVQFPTADASNAIFRIA